MEKCVTSHSLRGDSGITLRTSVGIEAPFPTEANLITKIFLVVLTSWSHSSQLPNSSFEGSQFK